MAKRRAVEVYQDDRDRYVAFAPKRSKEEDDYAHFSRGWMIPKVPCRMIIFGQSECGKTDIIRGILDGDISELSMQYDEYCALSSTKDDDLKAVNYREIRHPTETFPDKRPLHVVCVFDDPPPTKHKTFKEAVNYLYCNGRHKGFSPITSCQEIGFLTKDQMGFCKQNSHLIIFPTAKIPNLIKGLQQHNIISNEQIADLHTSRHPYMFNVVDKKRGAVYLLDRRPEVECREFKKQLRKV